MKKYLIIFIIILLVGSLAIFLPYFLSNYSQASEAKASEDQKESLSKKFKEIESNKNTMDQLEIPNDELEVGQENNNQMVFNNIETIYKYLTFNQADQVKQKLQFYIQNNLNNLKECSIKTDTLHEENKVLTFSVAVNGYKDINLEVKKDDNGKIIDISIIQSQ